MVKNILRSLIENPIVRDKKLGLPETSILHSRIIQENLFLKKIYEEWYGYILNYLPQDAFCRILELGTGGGFLKEYLPGLFTSDLLNLPDIDIIFDAQALPVKQGCLHGIVMTNVFHHLYDIDSFLKDAAFTVKPGGPIVMIEPWVTPWSRLIYRYFHYEPFDPSAKSWQLPEGEPGLRANMALLWIVFERDRERFKTTHPEWEIHKITLHTPFRYIISGGVSYKSLLPGKYADASRKIEFKLNAFMKYLAMFSTIVLIRKDIA